MIAILATRFGQTAALLIIAGIAWTTWIIQHDRKVETKAFEKVAAASQAQGERANARNEVVRKRAALPGSFERLRKDPRNCPTCFDKSLP